MSSYRQQATGRGRDFNISSIIQTCSGNVQRITHNTAQIQSLLNQLGTSKDSTKLQQNLQQIQHSTNVLAKETNTYLKDLASVPTPLSPVEQRQQKLQKERLMNEFSAALNHFQAVQRQVSQKEKETVARARAGSRLSNEERQKEEQLVSFDNNDDWNQMQSQEEDFEITEQDLELIKERESAIQKLEADILDVNQIFKDLAVMIHDQGEMIEAPMAFDSCDVPEALTRQCCGQQPDNNFTVCKCCLRHSKTA
uniref:Syntaxin 12 n=1 Tax=Leptobrachium leishanense TaxID=445787 RepID=A0A8C5LMP3_9ANUR